MVIVLDTIFKPIDFGIKRLWFRLWLGMGLGFRLWVRVGESVLICVLRECTYLVVIIIIISSIIISKLVLLCFSVISRNVTTELEFNGWKKLTQSLSATKK